MCLSKSLYPVKAHKAQTAHIVPFQDELFHELYSLDGAIGVADSGEIYTLRSI